MPVIPFGEFLPDLPALQNPGVVQAKNVLPSPSGFDPLPQWSASSDALTARPRGAIRERDFAGTAHSYAGDATKLYALSGTSWSDVTNTGGAYTTAANERWEFARWANKIIATNFSDNPQQITMGGANFSDLTSDFQARALAVVQNHVVFGNTNDATDGEIRDRVRWSAFGDETDYTVSASTLADFSDLLAGGAVQRITGGEYGVILQETSVRRMTFVGSPTVFQIDEVLPGIGLLAPGGAVRIGRHVFFLSQKGFVALTDGSRTEFIGANKVDRFVLDDIDTGNLDRVSAAADPVSGRVWFSYPGSGSTNGRPNKIVIYDTNLGRWSFVEIEHELIWQAGGVAIDLDTTDSSVANDDTLDLVDISFDSPRYKGGGRNIQMFDDTFKTGAFDGTENLAAEIQTGDREIFDGRNARLNAFRPIIEGGTITANIGTRNLLSENTTFTSDLSMNNGRITKRSNGRYHAFRFNLSGAWSNAVGLQVAKGDARAGERRA